VRYLEKKKKKRFWTNNFINPLLNQKTAGYVG